MSRRLTPYFVAGLLGALSGVYIFKPLFEERTVMGDVRGATGTAKSTAQPQSDTADQKNE